MQFEGLSQKMARHYLLLHFCLLLVGLIFFQRTAGPMVIWMAFVSLGFHGFLFALGDGWKLRGLSHAGNIVFAIAMGAVLWLALTMVWGELGLSVWKRSLSNFFLILSGICVVCFVRTYRQNLQIVPVFLCVFIFLAVVAIWGGLVPEIVYVPQVPSFYNRIFLTLTLFGFVLLAILVNSNHSRFVKLFLSLILFATLMWCAFAAGSQTTIIAGFLGLGLLGWCILLGRCAQTLALIGLCSVPLVMPILIFSASGYIDALRTADIGFFVNSSADVRLLIWKTSLEFAAQRPLLGWGHDVLMHLPADKPVSGLFEPFLPRLHPHPHNVFLQYWLEMGVMGAVFATLFLGAMARQIMGIHNDYRPYVIALFGATVSAAAVSHGAWQSWWLGTLILLIAFCRNFPSIDEKL